ncbi:MAG: TIGR02186 family protein, partial [Planctomycetota bacterium]
QITANFDGSEILIFGAVQRNAPLDVQGPVDVIVAVSGPDQPVTVRRKDRVAGIWVNTDSADFGGVPSFYKVATTRPLSQILAPEEDIRHGISIPRAIGSGGSNLGIAQQTGYLPAILRIRRANGLYTTAEGGVTLQSQSLFQTQIALPANLVEGTYLARILLTRDRKVVAEYETSIAVQKVGLERAIYRLAHDQPLAYGVLSLIIAIAAGWGASAVFRYLQG